tara:strand:+ start:3287 stop:3889 length:603 start_codon:yes stop_codon:yes gene_type:complete
MPTALDDNSEEVQLRHIDMSSCCSTMGNNNEQCPRLRAYWDTAPNIRVCDSLDLSIQEVSRAVDTWRSLGYRFGDITIARWTLQECNNSGFGDILIRLPTQNEISAGVAAGHLAATKTYTYNPTGQVRGADIWFVSQEGIKTKWVLEHEIGHALGWMHCEEDGHVMNSMSGNLGPIISGMSYAEYLLGRNIIREVLSGDR